MSVYFAGGILVEPTELLFTAQTWAQPQAVTVVAVDDNVAEAVEFASIWHNSTSSDPNYVIGSELIQRVNVTVISDDSAGLLVSASELAIAEGVGGECTYSVRLASQPWSSLTVDPSWIATGGYPRLTRQSCAPITGVW